jgi:hypothetical protein
MICGKPVLCGAEQNGKAAAMLGQTKNALLDRAFF